jgi:hypothetical protein
MPNVKLVALKKHPYGKSYLTPEQAFEAPERDANLLVRLGVAKRAGEEGAHPDRGATAAADAPDRRTRTGADAVASRRRAD